MSWLLKAHEALYRGREEKASAWMGNAGAALVAGGISLYLDLVDISRALVWTGSTFVFLSLCLLHRRTVWLSIWAGAASTIALGAAVGGTIGYFSGRGRFRWEGSPGMAVVLGMAGAWFVVFASYKRWQASYRAFVHGPTGEDYPPRDL